MARIPSTKTLALRALADPHHGAATRWAALQAAKPHLAVEEYSRLLRQLAATSRAKVLRLCLLELARLEREEQARASQANVERQAKPDAHMLELLTNGARPQATTTAVGAPKAIEAEPATTPQGSHAAPTTVPAGEVSSQPGPENEQLPRPVPAKTEPKPSIRPTWFPVEPPLDDARRFVNRLAARRQREAVSGELDDLARAAGFPFYAAMQSAVLAAERERRKPKRRYYGMPSCGSELNGET